MRGKTLLNNNDQLPGFVGERLLEATQEQSPRSLHTTIVSALIRNHEHHLPFEDTMIDQAATYARYVLVPLHLFELTAQEPCGC